MGAVLKRNGFPVGLLLAFLLPVLEGSGHLAGIGAVCRSLGGSEGIIVFLFVLSGIQIDPEDLGAGVSDHAATLLALALILVVSPLLAAALLGLPLQDEMAIGLVLVAVMPTTLSSGVVMTGAAGGRLAHALWLTLVSNLVAPVAIPVALSLLLEQASGDLFHPAGLMLRIGLLVVLPFVAGMGIGRRVPSLRKRKAVMGAVGQVLIVFMVFMAASGAREAVRSAGSMIPGLVGLALVFHLLLLLAGGLACRMGGLSRQRSKSVLLMGGQKTLPLSVILQTRLFPEAGVALAFCVIHHVVHLMMDARLVAWWKERDDVFAANRK